MQQRENKSCSSPVTLVALHRSTCGRHAFALFLEKNSKNVVFPAQTEYSYFSADFRLKIFLYYSSRDRFTVQRMLIYQNAVFQPGHAVSPMQAK